MAPEIVVASSAEELDEVRELLGEYMEYIASIWPDVDREAFAEEQRTLREMYRAILLARVDGACAGCVMLRDVEDAPGVIEARRLFVRPAFRRHGVARALMLRLLDEARALGCREIRLVTVKLFEGAIQLYESLGFQHRDPWRPTTMPLDFIVFMQRPLH